LRYLGADLGHQAIPSLWPTDLAGLTAKHQSLNPGISHNPVVHKVTLWEA